MTRFRTDFPHEFASNSAIQLQILYELLPYHNLNFNGFSLAMMPPSLRSVSMVSTLKVRPLVPESTGGMPVTSPMQKDGPGDRLRFSEEWPCGCLGTIDALIKHPGEIAPEMETDFLTFF